MREGGREGEREGERERGNRWRRKGRYPIVDFSAECWFGIERLAK